MANRKKCLSCGSDKISKIIDLGNHPFADTFLKAKKDLKKLPLFIQLCSKCGFIQSGYITKPSDRYIDHDYSYTSSNSTFATNHWDKYVTEISRLIELRNKKILEVGSNDGYLLKTLSQHSTNIYGVDASPYMVKLSKNLKLNCLHYIFGSSNYNKFKEKDFDIIIANNVFNHSNSPLNFIKEAKKRLKKTGLFIFEQPYWVSGIKDLRFDHIYHEHVSYFTVNNLINLFKSELYIYDCEFKNYHGGSIRVYASKTKMKKSNRLMNFIKKERKLKINTKKIYNEFMDKIIRKKSKFLKKIDEYHNGKYVIIGAGAAAKGNTFLNYYGLTNDKVKYITDNSSYKINKYTPGTLIRIKKDNCIKRYKKLVVFILSWNISIIIKKKMRIINKNVIFIDT